MLITKLNLDLLPAYIPFKIQCTDAEGAKTSPTVDNLAVYEENGADANELVTGDFIGNFDPVQLPTDVGKTGFWGINIAKSNFTAGRFYTFLWEVTVDGTTSAAGEMYFFENATQSMADVSALALEASVQYLNGKSDYNIAAVAVPARNVLVGMLESEDRWISATQKLHIEYTYNSNRNVVATTFTVV